MPRRRQTRNERTRAQRPAVELWIGRRVEYRRNDVVYTGLVIDVGPNRVGRSRTIMLRVARDDGFVDIGVPASYCRTVRAS